MSGPPRTPRFCVTSSGEVVARLRGLVPPSAFLSLTELERQAALARPGDRDDFLAVRLLARLMLAPCSALPDPSDPAEAVRRIVVRQVCARCGGPHGRPRVEGPGLEGAGVSWAHADGVVAVAVARGRVGVDVEHTDALSWVRAEALVKWGHADLDTSLGWSLTAEAAPEGRRWFLPSAGSPRTSRPLSAPWTRSVVVTDAAYADGTVLCAVAADRAAEQVPAPLP